MSASVKVGFEVTLASHKLRLSDSQWSTLRFLLESPGASGAEIARHTKVSPQAVTTMLQRMEKAGLITRQSASGRVVETHLTDAGKEMLRKGDAVVNEVADNMFSGFSAEEQKQFHEYMQRCIANLDSQNVSKGL